MDWLAATVGIVILVQEAVEVLSDADDVELADSATLRSRWRKAGAAIREFPPLSGDSSEVRDG